MPSPALAETQRYLWRLITAPEGVAAGLAAMDDEDPRLASHLGDIVVGDQRLSAVQRLDVYANMYFYRLLDSLKEDFPAVLAVAGEPAFHNLVTDYLIAHPPVHWSLRYAGQHVAGFLRTHPLAAERPWIADLAELEWGMLDAFDAADGGALTVADLEELAPDAWPEACFQASPGVRVLTSAWGIDDVWERVQRDEPAGEPERTPRRLLVWRRGLRVYNRPLDELEGDCLHLLLAGEPFAAWCERAAEEGAGGQGPGAREERGEETAAARVVGMLQRWLADGVLASVALGTR